MACIKAVLWQQGYIVAQNHVLSIVAPSIQARAWVVQKATTPHIHASWCPHPSMHRWTTCCRQRFNGLENILCQGTITQKVLMCAYFWAADLGLKQCEGVSGVDEQFVCEWYMQLRLICGYAKECACPKLGGPGTTFELDCSETGRFQKGIQGHKSFVRMDLMATVERGSGRLVMALFDKLKDQDEWCRRFGLETILEVLPMLRIREG